MDKILEKIIFEASDKKISSNGDFLSLVKENMKGQSQHQFPSNIILRKAYLAMIKAGKIEPNKTLEGLLVTKKMRSLSGVAIITVLTKPWPCPGKCLYCPTEKDVPKSYLSTEPAVMRAILCDYDPYKQVRARLDSLEKEGHPTDKIELIIIGGTFSALPRDYQEEFISQCLQALNDKVPISNFQSMSNNQISNNSAHSVIPAPDRVEGKAPAGIRSHPNDQNLIGARNTRTHLAKCESKECPCPNSMASCHSELDSESSEINSRFRIGVRNDNANGSLGQAKKQNETAKHRCVGLTLETRPDKITSKEAEWFRYLGATRVELGVQTVFDKVLELNKRGAANEDTICATKLLKDAGFKICYHMMPGLPGSDPKKDLEMFKIIFTDPNFQPDYIKIYPCMVTKGSELYDLWKAGKYQPYSDKELEDLICEIKKTVPYHIRIMRLIRDIPSGDIEAGSKVSNLRQNVQRKMEKEGDKCKCIRCRESGLNTTTTVIPRDFLKGRAEGSLSQNFQIPISNFQSSSNDQISKRKDSGQARMTTLFIDEYMASGGREIFLSYESEDRSVLYALLRLRFPGKTYLPELKDAAIIREVHTYGQQIEIGKKGETQHKGLGKKLIIEAEKIAKENGYEKIAIISGIGARDYYRKFGYNLVGDYMVRDCPKSS